MLKKGMLIADRYEILEKIGSGGMSDVYRARCHKLNRYVAVKVLKQEFSEDENFVSRFRIEAQSVAGLTHANIVNVYDVGDESGIYYIVMEIVEGITLKNYIDKKGKLAPKEAVSIAIQVAQGIEAAHNHGIVHRDIKPQNIIISREGKVKVTDFGIARAASSNTINSNVMGSVHYISPEQARGGYSDYKSDIYSFGIMLFEMLTGKVPFEGDTTVSIALKHIQEEVPSIRSIDETIPIAISQIVEKCTSKRKENRYESATVLIVDLKKSLVNPDAEIVAPVILPTESKTVMITKEEMSQIESAAKNADKDNHIKEEKVATAAVASTLLKAGSNSKKEDEFELVDDKDDEENSGWDKILLAIGICAALLVFVIAIYVVVWVFDSMNGDSGSSKPTQKPTQSAVSSDGKVEIPPIVGMSGAEAKKILNERGLGYVVTEHVSSELYEAGKVITQSLDSGTKVNPNTTVYVTLSSGPEEFSLQDYTNYDGEEIETLLSETYGLDVECKYEFSDEIELGKIISTSIKEGTIVKRGDDIVLYISRGKETNEATVPTILGITEQDAIKKLEQNGLVGGNVTYNYSSEYAEGLVMSQSVKEGKVVASGTSIDYVVSKGEEPTEKQPEYEYRGEVRISKDKFKEETDNGAKAEGFSNVTNVEIKLVLEQNGKETVIMSATSIDDITASTFEFVGEEGLTTGEVIMYARYTYQTSATASGNGRLALERETAETVSEEETEKQTETEKPTEPPTQEETKPVITTKVSQFIKVWSTDVTLKKTEVN